MKDCRPGWPTKYTVNTKDTFKHYSSINYESQPIYFLANYANKCNFTTAMRHVTAV